MVSGDDAIESEVNQHAPPSGLPQERFLLGDHLPIAPVLLLGQSGLEVNPNEVIACLQPVHLHATRGHLILMAQSQIDLTEHESSQLLQTAQFLFNVGDLNGTWKATAICKENCGGACNTVGLGKRHVLI